VVVRGECAEWKGGSFLKVLFFCDCIVESAMEMVKVEGGIAILLSEHSGDDSVLEFVVEDSPFIVEVDHGFNAFFTLLLERCGGDGLRGGVRCWCMFRTGYLRCHLLG